ncbi:MAG: hypothetical protein ABMB14_39840, partial [Myxococcota bacterium]
AARAPVRVGPPVQATNAFVLSAFDRSLGGTAVVAVDDTSWALLGLGPAGTALFTVRSEGGQTAVTAPDDRMAEVLGRMPLERDLWLLYRWQCDDRCRTDHGRIDVDGDTTRWRGRDGRATIVTTDGRRVLEDPLRHYTLTVLVR